MCSTEFVANCIEFAAVVVKREVCKVPRHEGDSCSSVLCCELACTSKAAGEKEGDRSKANSELRPR